MPNIESIYPSNEKDLWLALFNAETEKELENLAQIRGATMSEAVQAYHSITSSEEYRILELKRSMAKHDEAQALYNAERKRDKHWQGEVDKVVAETDEKLAKKDEALVKKDDEITQLRKQIEELINLPTRRK